MFIRGFLKIIRPSNKHLLEGNRNGRFMHSYIVMYKYVLTQLKKAYSYYAVSDTVFLKNESIRIVHECRDVGFENELKRIGIDIHTHMQEMQMPVNYIKKRSRFYNFFKWDNQFIVYYGDKEVAIYRGRNITIDGTLNSKVLLSLPTDVICRCHIDVQSNYAAESLENQYKSTALKRDGGTKSRIFSKEIIHSTKSKSNSVSYNRREKETQKIAKQGFEIDTTF